MYSVVPLRRSAKKPPTHRPQQTLSKRRQTKGPRNVPSARGGPVGFVKRSSSPATPPQRIDRNNRSANVAKQKDRVTYQARRVVFVGFVKRSSSPAKKPPTHRPQQTLSKRRQTKGLRNVPCARGGLRGRWFSNTKVRLRRSEETARCRARRSSGNRDLGNGRLTSYGRNP